MKKTASYILFLGLISTYIQAKECTLILLPSDFQLDAQLKAPNESHAFSVIGNFFYASNMRGYAKGLFCNALDDNDAEKRRACIQDLAYFIEKDSPKLNGNTFNDMTSDTFSYGYKGSSQVPITKEHLCIMQKKYKINPAALPRPALIPFLENKQAAIRKNYLEAATFVSQSNNSEEIAGTLIQIENKNQ